MGAELLQVINLLAPLGASALTASPAAASEKSSFAGEMQTALAQRGSPQEAPQGNSANDLASPIGGTRKADFDLAPAGKVGASQKDRDPDVASALGVVSAFLAGIVSPNPVPVNDAAVGLSASPGGAEAVPFTAPFEDQGAHDEVKSTALPVFSSPAPKPLAQAFRAIQFATGAVPQEIAPLPGPAEADAASLPANSPGLAGSPQPALKGTSDLPLSDLPLSDLPSREGLISAARINLPELSASGAAARSDQSAPRATADIRPGVPAPQPAAVDSDAAVPQSAAETTVSAASFSPPLRDALPDARILAGAFAVKPVSDGSATLSARPFAAANPAALPSEVAPAQPGTDLNRSTPQARADVNFIATHAHPTAVTTLSPKDIPLALGAAGDPGANSAGNAATQPQPANASGNTAAPVLEAPASVPGPSPVAAAAPRVAAPGSAPSPWPPQNSARTPAVQGSKAENRPCPQSFELSAAQAVSTTRAWLRAGLPAQALPARILPHPAANDLAQLAARSNVNDGLQSAQPPPPSADVREARSAAPLQKSAAKNADSAPPAAASAAAPANAASALPPPPSPHSPQSDASAPPPASISAPDPAAENHGSANPGSSLPVEPRPAPPADLPPPPAPVTGNVQAARMVESLGQQEMHIGLNTDSFGNVEVHTLIHNSQVNLAVGSERGDLRTLLTAEVPGLQANFQQHELRFESIRFLAQHPGGAGTAAGFSHGGDSQPRGFRHTAGRTPFYAAPQEKLAEPEMLATATRGLSVHA